MQPERSMGGGVKPSGSGTDSGAFEEDVGGDSQTGKWKQTAQEIGAECQTGSGGQSGKTGPGVTEMSPVYRSAGQMGWIQAKVRFSPGVDESQGMGCPKDVGSSGPGFKHGGAFSRFPGIVCVQETNEVSAGCLDSGGKGGGLTFILGMLDDSGMVLPLLEDFPGAVAGGVVDQDQIQVDRRLIQNRADSSGQESSIVIVINDDTYFHTIYNCVRRKAVSVVAPP